MSWTLDNLKSLFAEQSYEISEEDECLLLRHEDGLEAFLTASGDEVIASSLLFPASSVKDVNALNAEVLSTHKLFPLTTIGTVSIDGELYYEAFGALSSQSKQESVLLEIELLFQNVEGILETFELHLQ